MNFAGVYSTAFSDTFTGARGLVELTAPADQGVVILRAEAGPIGTSPADELLEMNLDHLSGLGDGSSDTPARLNPKSPVSASTVEQSAGTPGTSTSVLLRVGFHAQSGFLYLPVPEERIVIDGGASFGFKLAVGPAASTLWAWTLIWAEL